MDIESIKQELPSLAKVMKSQGLDLEMLGEHVLELLPKDATYLAIFNSNLFLTDRGILKYSRAVFSGKVKASEVIPVSTLTSVELKKPGINSPGIWSLKLVRANNIDDEFSAWPEPVLRDFVSKVQMATAGPLASPATSKPSPIEQLKGLAELRDQGIVSEEEFQAKKAQLLSEM
jgi:hypothetical protein